MLSGFLKIRPDARLETVAGMSVDLQRSLSAGEIDIAIVKREPGSGETFASWPESLVWVCIYRQRAIRSRDKAKRAWRIAFGSQSLTGIQAAVAAGLAVSVLAKSAILSEHRICSDMPPLPPSELALLGTGTGIVLSAVRRTLVEFLTRKIKRA